MRFYLQRYQLGDRLLIDREKHFGYVATDECEASEWLEAKRKFGFWLTPAQEKLLRSGPLEERLKRLEEERGNAPGIADIIGCDQPAR